MNKIDIDNMSGIEFERFIQLLLSEMGLIVKETKVTGDGGIDLIAYSNQAVFEGKYIIQCKRWGSAVGEPPVRDLYGVTCSERANKGILITNNTFTSNAIEFAKDKPIELIDREKLNKLILEYNMLENKNISNFKISYCMDNIDFEDWNQKDKVNQLLEYIEQNPNNLLVRIDLMELLFTELINCLSQDDKQLVSYILNLLEVHCKYIINFKYPSKDLTSNFLSNLGYLILAHIKLIQGEIKECIYNIIRFYKWIELNYPENKDDSILIDFEDESYVPLYIKEIKITLIYNIVQLLMLLNLEEEANQIYKKNYKVIEEKINEEIINREECIGCDDLIKLYNRAITKLECILVPMHYNPVAFFGIYEAVQFSKEMNSKYSLSDKANLNACIDSLELDYNLPGAFLHYDELMDGELEYLFKEKFIKVFENREQIKQIIKYELL